MSEDEFVEMFATCVKNGRIQFDTGSRPINIGSRTEQVDSGIVIRVDWTVVADVDND